MDWGGLTAAEIAEVEDLAPSDPDRMMARLRGAFELRHADPDRACTIVEEEQARAEARGHRLALARAYLVANYVVGDEWDPDTMLDRLVDACALFEEVGDDWGLMRAADLAAFIYEGMGDYPTVLDYTERALASATRAGDRTFEANARSSLAGVLTAADDRDGARAQLDAALEIADELDSDRLRGRLYIRRGRLNRDLGNPQDALRDFEAARRCSSQANTIYGVAEVRGEIARTHESLGDLETAEQAYLTSIEAMTGEVRMMIAPLQLLGLARTRLAMDRPRAALDPLDELQAPAERYSSVPILAEASKLRAEAQRRLGNFEAAYAALERHLAFRETMMAGEAQRAVKRNEVKAHLDAARQEAEIQRLRYVELAGMQTQLLESERMATVGNLAAGITHEMNTPLGAARSSLDTARRAFEKMQAKLPDEAKDAVTRTAGVLEGAIQTSEGAIDRLSGLVDNLRRFTRLDEAERQSFDVGDGLAATLEVIRAQCPAGVRVEAALGDTPEIEGWPSAFNQALLNLLDNAVEALGDAGEIRVTSARTAEGIRVTVADDGPGVPAAIRDRLFEPELTRQGARARMRVGLPMVKSIVQRHHGRITLDTEVERGATFHIDLPV